MAKKPQILTAICRVNGELVCEIDLTTKEIKRFMPQDKWDNYKKKMLDNIGTQLSRSMQANPDSLLWNL